MDENHLAQDEKHCHFTVFIRLPFPRGDFVDPPPVSTTQKGAALSLINIPQIDWDSSKDRALWDILSRAPKGREADCTNFSTLNIFPQVANDYQGKHCAYIRNPIFELSWMCRELMLLLALGRNSSM